jgi:hypothetical protein
MALCALRGAASVVGFNKVYEILDERLGAMTMEFMQRYYTEYNNGTSCME